MRQISLHNGGEGQNKNVKVLSITSIEKSNLFSRKVGENR